MPHTHHPTLLQNKPKNPSGNAHINVELMTLSRQGILEEDVFSEEALLSCVDYLKLICKQRTSEIITANLGNGTSIFVSPAKQVHFLPISTFHLALIHRSSFAKAVIENLSAEESRYIVTSLVDYKMADTIDGIGEGNTADEVEVIGSLAVSTWENNYFQKEVGSHYQLILSLAVMNEDADLIKVLVESGADLPQTDEHGNNIIHGLVQFSQGHPEKSVKMLHSILQLAEDPNTKVQLLLRRNNQKQTPLDMAAEKCIPEMIHALINTDGVYRFVIRNAGIHVHFLYDITHYEKDEDQRGKGLLDYISVITEEQLRRLDNFKLLDKEPFATWLNVKAKSNINHTRFWMVMWFMYVFLYLVSIVIYGHTRKELPKWYSIMMLCVSTIFALSEIKGMYLYYPYFKMVLSKLRRGLFPITCVSAYRIFQTFFIVTVTITETLDFCSLNCTTKININLYLQTLNVVFGFMSLMFFTQLSKAMGHYLTVIEKMILNTLAFLALSFFIFTACAVSFHITYISPICSENGTVITNETSADLYGSFSTMYHSLYETFLLALAVTAPKDWYFTDSHNPHLTVAIYIICILIITLVLLNLLIAIMNERVVEICKHKHSVLKINQLSIYLLMDERRKSDQVLLRWSRWLSNWADIYKYYYTTKHRDRIFLHVMERSDLC